MLAAVHCARRDLGLDEDTYRAVLERVTGSTSAASLTDDGLQAVLDAFRAQGWKSPHAEGRRRRASGSPHVRKLWAIWTEMCAARIPREPTRAALRSFVQRMTDVADPEWLTGEQVNVVLEALKAWQRRELEARGTNKRGTR